ncbi:hypothetical protein FI146_620003 [Flavobacterium psychrophilum]|nr:hypothetical protein FI146_620003 [Flavobacterium psychrophilum]
MAVILTEKTEKMKNIKFIEAEKTSLIEIIRLGNSQYDESFSKHGESLLTKIEVENYEFSNKELLVLKSYTSNWINNNAAQIDSIFEKYWNKNVNNYLNIEENERIEMRKIDLMFSLKSKLFSKKHKTFENVFEKIEKLKQSETIFISNSNDGKPYKIAFVNLKQNEIFKFELNNLNNFESISFDKKNKSELNEIGRKYAKVCNKKEASEIFNNQNEIGQNEIFDFCRILLN